MQRCRIWWGIGSIAMPPACSTQDQQSGVSQLAGAHAQGHRPHVLERASMRPASLTHAHP